MKQRAYETTEYRLQLHRDGWELELAKPFGGGFNEFFSGKQTGVKDLESAVRLAEQRAARRAQLAESVDRQAAELIVAEDQQAVRDFMRGCGTTRVEVAEYWRGHVEANGQNPLDLVQEARVKFTRDGVDAASECPKRALWVSRDAERRRDRFLLEHPERLGRLDSHDLNWIGDDIAAVLLGDDMGVALTAAQLGRAHGSVAEIFSVLMRASVRASRYGQHHVSLGPPGRSFRERAVTELCIWNRDVEYHHQSTHVLPGWDSEEKTPSAFESGRAMIEYFAARHARIMAELRVILAVDQDAPPLEPRPTPDPEPDDYLQSILTDWVLRAEGSQ